MREIQPKPLVTSNAYNGRLKLCQQTWTQLLRRAADTLEYDSPHGIESFVDHFAFAVKRGSLA